MIQGSWETRLSPRSVFSTQVDQLLDRICTLSGIVTGAKSSWSMSDARGVRTNFQRGWQAPEESRHIYPISGSGHMSSTNPNDEDSKW